VDDIRSVFAYYSPMGGERASTTRMRESGRICCSCKVPLESPPAKHGERYCDRCEPRRKVYMHFMLATDGWRVTFLEDDLKTPLPRKMIFQDSIKVIEMALRGGAGKVLADRQAIEHGISLGRGSAWLSLTSEQYAKLKTRRR
jgi:hypothetical protein